MCMAVRKFCLPVLTANGRELVLEVRAAGLGGVELKAKKDTVRWLGVHVGTGMECVFE